MKCSTVLAAVLLLGVVLCVRAKPERVSVREEDPLDDDLSDRANLLFRAMDKNRDMMLDAEDARASEEQLELHMPGISPSDFVEFIQLADKNNDGKLSRFELFQGLADGISQNEEAAEPESLIEAEAEVHTEADGTRKGIGGFLKKGLKAAGRFAKRMLFGKKGRKGRGGAKGGRSGKGRVNKKADGCVMCQYIVERLESNVKQSGVIPAMSQAQGLDGLSFLELEEEPMSDVPANSGDEFSPFGMVPPMETPSVEANPLSGNSVQMPEINIGGSPSDANLPQEVPAIQLVDESEESQVMLETEQLYLDQTAAGIIGSTRQSTRVQRQLERQKYNEIYRVVDITLDDVCEQSMPNSFYGFCKQIYKVQSDVVDGLRYQYRPTDICFRIGMCGKKSYITKGIHSRYK